MTKRGVSKGHTNRIKTPLKQLHKNAKKGKKRHAFYLVKLSSSSAREEHLVITWSWPFAKASWPLSPSGLETNNLSEHSYVQQWQCFSKAWTFWLAFLHISVGGFIFIFYTFFEHLKKTGTTESKITYSVKTNWWQVILIAWILVTIETV